MKQNELPEKLFAETHLIKDYYPKSQRTFKAQE